MGNPLRNKDPEIYRLITVRTEGARLWMRPSKDVNKIIHGVLARYSEIFQVVTYAYIFLSNHYHLLIKSPLSNTDEFIENVNREIARRLNWKLHRAGKFWGRRYSEQEVLSEDDLLQAYLYILTNAVKHGLEKDPSKWPGVSSYAQCITEKSATYPFYHYSAESEELRITHHTLTVTPLPQFQELPKAERVALIKSLIEARAVELIEKRTANHEGFLGADAVKEQDPHSTPFSIARSPRPSCYTKNIAFYREFIQSTAIKREQYRESSMRYRLGDLTVEFPLYTFKPPLHRKPRLTPFNPLPDDYFQKAV